MNIFKKIDECLRLCEKDKSTLEKVRYFALEEIREYIYGLAFLKKNSARERMEFIIKAKFDYKLVMEELDLSYDAVKSCVYYASNLATKQIGGLKNLENLLYGDSLPQIRSAMLKFDILKGLDITDILVLSSDYLSAKFNPFILEECTAEINFLRRYSKVNFDKHLQSLDTKKIEYLLFILKTDSSKFVEEKKMLIEHIRKGVFS